MNDHTTSRSASFAVTVVGLAAICVGLGTMMFIMIDAATTTTAPAEKKLLARLSWLALLLLCLALLMTVWVILRRLRDGMRSKMASPPEPTPYVNAWELAGKRFQLNDDNEPEDPDYLCDDVEDEDDDEDDDDDEGPDRPGRGDRWR